MLSISCAVALQMPSLIHHLAKTVWQDVWSSEQPHVFYVHTVR